MSELKTAPRVSNISDVRTAAVTALTSPTEGFPGGSLGRDGGRGGGGGGVGLTEDGVAGRTGEEDPERNIYLADDDTEKWVGDKTPKQGKESGKLELRFSDSQLTHHCSCHQLLGLGRTPWPGMWGEEEGGVHSGCSALSR